MIGIKPILSIKEDGTLQDVCKARKTSGALKKIKQRFLASSVKKDMVCIVHSNTINQALELKADLELEQSFTHVFIADIGPAIGSHTGPECLGLAYIKN